MIMVITGNPVQGFDFFGPFDDPQQAVDWAADLIEADWWVAELTSPARYEW